MIESRRQYRTCSACRESIYFADDAFGLEGRYSIEARRLAVLAGTSWSFDKASEHLEEFCADLPSR